MECEILPRSSHVSETCGSQMVTLFGKFEESFGSGVSLKTDLRDLQHRPTSCFVWVQMQYDQLGSCSWSPCLLCLLLSVSSHHGAIPPTVSQNEILSSSVAFVRKFSHSNMKCNEYTSRHSFNVIQPTSWDLALLDSSANLKQCLKSRPL